MYESFLFAKIKLNKIIPKSICEEEKNIKLRDTLKHRFFQFYKKNIIKRSMKK